MTRRASSWWWILVAVLLFAGVAATAVWRGWSQSNDALAGPAPITLRDVIRSRGGGLGSKP